MDTTPASDKGPGVQTVAVIADHRVLKCREGDTVHRERLQSRHELSFGLTGNLMAPAFSLKQNENEEERSTKKARKDQRSPAVTRGFASEAHVL